MNLLGNPGTFDIYRATDAEGRVSYTPVPCGETPPTPAGTTLTQMTVGTPPGEVSNVIADLDRSRRNRKAES